MTVSDEVKALRDKVELQQQVILDQAAALRELDRRLDYLETYNGLNRLSDQTRVAASPR